MGLFGGGGGLLGSIIRAPLGLAGGITDAVFGGQAPPGYDPGVWAGMGSIEQQAGAKPPDFESMRDKDGNLKSNFQINPYAGKAQQALEGEAFAQGDSPWAKMQTQQLNQEQLQARDQVAKQGAQALGQGQAELARFGGLGGGARERMAMGGAKNLMLANQDINRQGMMGRMGIGQQDLARKQGLLSNFANAENQAQQGNIGSMQGDIANKQSFDMNRYNQIMQAWSANKSAQAQAQAANSGGGKGK